MFTVITCLPSFNLIFIQFTWWILNYIFWSQFTLNSLIFQYVSHWSKNIFFAILNTFPINLWFSLIIGEVVLILLSLLEVVIAKAAIFFRWKVFRFVFECLTKRFKWYLFPRTVWSNRSIIIAMHAAHYFPLSHWLYNYKICSWIKFTVSDSHSIIRLISLSIWSNL